MNTKRRTASLFRSSFRRVKRSLVIGLVVAIALFCVLQVWMSHITPHLGWGLVTLAQQMALAYCGGFIFWFIADHWGRSARESEVEEMFNRWMCSILWNYLQFLTLTMRGTPYQVGRHQQLLYKAWTRISEKYIPAYYVEQRRGGKSEREITDRLRIQINAVLIMGGNAIRTAKMFVHELNDPDRFLFDRVEILRKQLSPVDYNNAVDNTRKQFDLVAHLFYEICDSYARRVSDGYHVDEAVVKFLHLTDAILISATEGDNARDEISRLLR